MDRTQKNFDVKKYLGDWYEIAKYPTWFEKGCVFAKAHYTWDGNFILIRNTCLDKNQNVERESYGKARIPDINDKSKLKVKFFGEDAYPYEGDYNVHWTDYVKYSIVGGGGLLWILARTPSIPKEDVAMLLNKVESFGYDSDKLLSNKKLLF